ncbi:conjugative transfer ATPase [Escherichia albertii]|uniref:conjugative transfer ATPase n=1 Tax=Escherichia albertii TaxID=208962 RepID=UPI0015627130|nr:conjugative transfer ATPase [Escherichia albertii]EJY9800253.1 conjugative transfer ATPase [Escherichia albertii]MCU7326337.1 conjugative transfer ATPase [Escherichia albertii]MCU7335548.1 conjugative transfer ATPase [Escherichia albertii]MCU7339576.1 conjugative transfer ATPase [Escherichia albertii]MCU7343022.1 conjugative transfer ATPase [Escherichia albertii]
MMFSLFTKKQPQPAAAESSRPELKKSGRLTQDGVRSLYPNNVSFIDFLPWVEYLPESQSLLLDDGVSVGAVFEVVPVGTEGRTEERLDEIRDIVEDALQDSFDERDSHPWIVQFFCQDETDVTEYIDKLRGYVKPWAQGTAFTNAYMNEMERHMRGIAVPKGLFIDKAVTGAPWRGQQRRTRMVIYRYVNLAANEPYSPEEQLNQVCERLSSALAGAGIVTARQNGEQIHAWLLRWFNPEPDWVDKETLYRTAAHVDTRNGELPVLNDFSETLMFTPPRSDVENGVWWFDERPHKAVTIDRIRRAPSVGHLTGETRKGENINALMDLLPEGTVISLALVVQPQDVLEERFNHLAKNAIGENTESERVRADADMAKSYLGERHKMYRASMTFFLSGSSLKILNSRQRDLTAILLNAGLQPVKPEYDVAPLNGYLRALPMCFNPTLDKKNWYTRLTFVQHMANMLPVFGRDTGTGHPGFTFFNRGGAPLTFDPLNSADRSKNAHLVLFGPTGSGKSATLNSLFAQLMAIHRPRLFIAEAGNSFGLFADYCAELELSVNKVSIKPGCGISLAPFADAYKLIEAPVKNVDESELSERIEVDETDDGDAEEERDILGELEIVARLMVTGGEAKEEARLERADRGMMREAILAGARKAWNEDRQMITADLQDAFYAFAKDESRPEVRRARAQNMGESLGVFMQGFLGELFNRPGQNWPEADVTLIDLGTLAREGYEAPLAVAYTSLVNTINNIAERDQFLDREIVFPTDEAHMITTNPLLAPYVVKVVKMWRKLGAWLWLATQNLEDFPATAKKMLNMIEWWLCLVMPPEEVEEIARFKKLTAEQKAMLLSATKTPRCYTEGVVLATRIEALFRAVPPSLYLALGMTEKDEKAARRALMVEHGISELDAAKRIAHQLDIARGIATTEAA